MLFLVGGSIACGVKVVCDHNGGIECTATSPYGWALLRTPEQGWGQDIEGRVGWLCGGMALGSGRCLGSVGGGG